MKVTIRLLELEDDVSSFSCGNREYDEFLQRYAYINQNDLYIGKTHVAVEGDTVTGYVTTAPGEMRYSERPSSCVGMPRYPIPILRLARLAVSENYQHVGVGRKLVRFVLQESLKMNSLLGCTGVLLDALPERVSFYQELGFQEVTLTAGMPAGATTTRAMFIWIGDIESALR